MEQRYRRGDILELTITDLVYGGRGLAREDDFVWFVERALPGQTVRAKVHRRRKTYGEAYTVEVISPSPWETDPPCPVFGTCGGCGFQNLAYSRQVASKAAQIGDLVRRVGGIADPPLLPAIEAERLYHYRNKMEFSFCDYPWRMDEREGRPDGFALGLHVPRRFDRVLDLDACLIMSEKANAVFASVREMALASGLPPYNLKSHVGYLRFLIIREGSHTGDLMVNLVTSGQQAGERAAAVDRLAAELLHRHPEITTLIHSVSDKLAQAAFADSARVLHGEGKIREKIGGRLFEISADAFFQTNSFQTEKLFSAIAGLAGFSGNETVYDLYCGTGAIGIFLADTVKNVLGIEVVEQAVKDARRNASLNSLANIEFITADMKDAISDKQELERIFGAPDAVILDPPRGGTHPKTVKHLLRLNAPAIVYVSCNPSILARDLDILCHDAYRLEALQPVDMFPHTAHIESIALLKRR
ncbi:23S rRNA (uracil(1939)-C(5))-methyltransferase RlmD [bacterium]|nr:23S rRNA (uracil(1939)-C(5))-methyltransferase RlmD [bacterium]